MTEKKDFTNVTRVLREELLSTTNQEISEANVTIEERIERLQFKALQLMAQKNPDAAGASEALVQAMYLKTSFWAIRSDEKTELWMYNEGIYIPNAITYIKEFVRETFGENISTTILNLMIKKIEWDNFIDQKEFQEKAPQNLIPVQNGLLNINTKELEEYTPEYVFIAKLPIHYDPTADCPAIKQFYEEVLGRKEDFLVIEEMYGYFLIRAYPFEKSFMLLGKGSNGKSKHIDLCQAFLGPENTTSVALDQIEKDQYAKATLFGKYANLAGDISKKPIEDSSDFKGLTGGDYITANRKHMTHLHFKNYAKMVFSANDLPITYDESDGFFRRWIIIDFPHKFVHPNVYRQLSDEEKAKVREADPNIMDKLVTTQELSGLLNIAIKGLQRIRDQNGFSNTEMVEAIRNKWRRKSNSFFAFLADEIIIDFQSRIIKEDLRVVFAKYCQEHGLNGVSDKVIKITLEGKGVVEKRIRIHEGNYFYETASGERLLVWHGIKYKNGVQPDLNSFISVYKPSSSEQMKNDEVVRGGQGGQGVVTLSENDPSHKTKPISHDLPDHPRPVINNSPKSTPKPTSLNSVERVFRQQYFLNTLKELLEAGMEVVDGIVWLDAAREYHKKMIPNWRPPNDWEDQFDKVIANLKKHGEVLEIKPDRWRINK